MNETGPAVARAHTATNVPPEAVGGVLVCGSHAGEYAGWLLARAGVAAAVLHDAAVGKDRAGVGSLARFEPFGFALAAVDAASADIGDADDMFERGVIGHVNAPAQRLGVRVGMACAEAAEALRGAVPLSIDLPAHRESRTELDVDGVSVVCVDSAADVTGEDDGRAVFCGSHGGVVKGQPHLAIRAYVQLAVYNDAGGGAGCGRLAVLDARGIAAATVAASSARIGDGRSTFEDGLLSAVNERAAALGLMRGMVSREAVRYMRGAQR